MKKYQITARNNYIIVEFETMLPCSLNILDKLSWDDRYGWWKNKKLDKINEALDSYKMPRYCKCLVLGYYYSKNKHKWIRINKFEHIRIEFNNIIRGDNNNTSQRLIKNPEEFLKKLLLSSISCGDIITYSTIYLYKRKYGLGES